MFVCCGDGNLFTGDQITAGYQRPGAAFNLVGDGENGETVGLFGVFAAIAAVCILVSVCFYFVYRRRKKADMIKIGIEQSVRSDKAIQMDDAKPHLVDTNTEEAAESDI